MLKEYLRRLFKKTSPSDRALKKALSSYQSSWMKGITAAQREISFYQEGSNLLISSNFRLVDVVVNAIKTFEMYEDDVDVRDPEVLDYLSGYRSRMLLELDRLGYHYDPNLGAIPHANKTDSIVGGEDP